MLDMSELMEKQETKRKCTLLKSLKIALESLMFERSSAFFSTVTQSSGTLTMFCRHIVDCLLDGARLARADVVDDSPRVFWSLCVHLLDSPDSPVRNQFESARESSSSTSSSSSSSASSHYSMLTDWIFYSLRHHCLLVQLEYLLAPANRTALASHFTPSAFLLDDLFVHDFLLYIKAFEKNNYAVLSKIKKTLFHLNQQIEECDAYLNKCQSPIGDGTSVVVSRNESCQDLSSSVSTGPISSSLTSPRSRLIVQQHRRMHSFPNIQINLAKKTEAATAAKQPLENTTNKPIKTTSQNSIAATSQNSVIPTLALNDHEISYSRIDSFDSTSIHSLTSTTATSKREDIYSASNIFDLIHGVQINCEVSPLDKENSHFVIADLAIAAVEMIKTSSCFRPSKPPPASKYLSSSSIRINSSSSSTISPPRRTPAAILENIDSLDDFSYTGSPPSIPPVSSSRLAKAVVTRRTKSLDLVDLDRVKRGGKKPRRCRSVNSIDSSRATTIVAVRNGPVVSKPGATANFSLFENSLDSFSLTTSEVSSSFTSGSPFGQTATSKLLKFSSPPRQDQSKQSVPEKPLLSKASKPVSLSRSRTDPLFTNDSGDDLDDLIKRPSANNSHHNDHNHMETINETESKSVGKPSLVRLESQRSRRFSWEEIEDLFSAENIAKELLKKCLKRLSKQKHNQSTNNRVSRLSKQLDESGLVPTVLDMEFFIKFMEYYEFLQSYYESKAFARARRFVFGSPAAAAAESEKSGGARSGNMTAMSASTIFWSHSSPANATVLVNDLSVSPASSLSDADRGGVGGGISALFNRNKSTVVSTLGSSSLKVKSAAYLLGNQNLHDQFEKQSAETTLTDTTTTSATTDQQSRSNLNLMMSSMNSNASFNSSISSAGTLIGTSNPSSSSHSGAARIIGDELWAPVREQLILNLHAKHKRAEQMQAQHYRCADCGIQVPYDKIKSFLYCEYFGKYFCRCCHVSQQSYIPAYVIYLSDYRTTFEVSKKAKNFLEKIYNEPLITLESLNPNLFRDESSVFVKMKKLRTKLYNSRSYLNSCRFSADLKAALETQFDDFIINDQHVYSIQSLFKLRKSNYFDQFRSLVNRVMEHIKSCELCSQQGYICGVCNRPDLLYPFDFESVEKCPNCLACYHRTCFKSPETCPRCLRKKLRASKQSS